VSLAKWNVKSFYRGRDFLLLKKRFCQLNAPPTLRAASRKLSRQMCLYSLFSSFSDLQEEQFGAVVLSSCLSYLLQIVNKIFIYHLMCQTSLLYFSSFSFLFCSRRCCSSAPLLFFLFFFSSVMQVCNKSLHVYNKSLHLNFLPSMQYLPRLLFFLQYLVGPT
jgi:predicted neutral ceramidase superfamily lipid hydrolase